MAKQEADGVRSKMLIFCKVRCETSGTVAVANQRLDVKKLRNHVGCAKATLKKRHSFLRIVYIVLAELEITEAVPGCLSNSVLSHYVHQRA